MKMYGTNCSAFSSYLILIFFLVKSPKFIVYVYSQLDYIVVYMYINFSNLIFSFFSFREEISFQFLRNAFKVLFILIIYFW